MGKAILTGAFNHETNTFSKNPSGIAEFEAYYAIFGEQILTKFRNVNHEQSGFIDCADQFGWELVPSVVATANPGGTVTKQAFERYGGAILKLAGSRRWDGIALSLHGAMVAEGVFDAEGDLLEELRAIVGSEVPIAITLDLHANVSEKMCRHANIIVSYKTYPHVDMRDAAVHAGQALEFVMENKLTIKTIIRQPPQIEGLDGGRTDVEPMTNLIPRLKEMESEDGIFAVSLNAGFALADVPFVGPSVTVSYDEKTERRAIEIVNELEEAIWQSRDRVNNEYLTPQQAAQLAKHFNEQSKPLVIADYSDNPGAGSYGDATNLLKALLEAGVTEACFGAVCDPEAAQILCQVKVGEKITLNLGGKNDSDLGGGPLRLTGEILGIYDGNYLSEGPMYAGLTKSFGPTAVFRVEGVDILVTTHNLQILDRMQFASFGIHPEKLKVVALKSMQHFRAAYEPLAAKVIVCDSGALARPRRSTLPFRNVRRPVYPLDVIAR